MRGGFPIGLASCPVLTKQKAVNFGGVEVQILKTFKAQLLTTTTLCMTNQKTIPFSFKSPEEPNQLNFRIQNKFIDSHHVSPSSVSHIPPSCPL